MTDFENRRDERRSWREERREERRKWMQERWNNKDYQACIEEAVSGQVCLFY